MTERFRKIINCIVTLMLVLVMSVAAHATPIDDMQNSINEDQNALGELNDLISDMEDAQDLLEEEISDLNAELINTMAEIDVLEESIAEQEEAIRIKQGEVDMAEATYYAAYAVQEKEHADMVAHIRYTYENGDSTIWQVLFSDFSFGNFLAEANYMEAIFNYDKNLYASYQQTTEATNLMWEELQIEEQELEIQKAALEVDKAGLEVQTAHLDDLLARKKAESASFDAQIAQAQKDAKALATRIKQEKAELKRLKAEEAARAAAAAAASTYNVNTSVGDIINNASGSDLGKQIARYGCQYIGYPYVYGGNSLTNGTDCSGFTSLVLAHFGYAIPRTSLAQRSAGKEVAYADAQPGDIICYDGHVALYIGGGYIVHASSAKTGIKVSKATYRTILSVRRVI